MKPLCEYEYRIWSYDRPVIGIDEAGRGPLAGPLVVAGVVLPLYYYHPDINDSKKLSAKKRRMLYDIIANEAIAFSIDIVDVIEIDRLNIYQATKRSMEKIALYLPAKDVLIDAMPINSEKNTLSLIKGDAKSISIAAASILAKVTRDMIMDEYDLIYPEYQFKKNKGYPTKTHIDALNVFGYTPIHRKSYQPVALSKRIKY
ncbi:MAG: ribonuclease HII [Erysipelotrichaceae bacterium]|jgi:ribonuclease HII|nr:ribonuclease HII [Erysipelotrichaceae bacterium]MDD3923593.1 ribonuclease HII [Erysipelotrichaceae bacterium]MDD4642303.1 ribonuclease HII [Erysipelotrichaceae bacterium]